MGRWVIKPGHCVIKSGRGIMRMVQWFWKWHPPRNGLPTGNFWVTLCYVQGSTWGCSWVEFFWQDSMAFLLLQPKFQSLQYWQVQPKKFAAQIAVATRFRCPSLMQKKPLATQPQQAQASKLPIIPALCSFRSLSFTRDLSQGRYAKMSAAKWKIIIHTLEFECFFWNERIHQLYW